MKFGLLTEFWPQINNLGDHVQSMAIEYLYSLMGIHERDIRHIGLRDLTSYDGEQILLPWNYAPICIPTDENGTIYISEKITPVFLGFTFSYISWARKFISIEHFMDTCRGRELLLRCAPIGCRDENTRIILEGYGIRAYLQGCITNIFPARKNGDYQKVILADCNAEVSPYIPHSLMQNAEVITNEVFAGDITGGEMYQLVKDRYSYFRDNAALMVSGRFHIVTPCYAMGIPSILIERKEPFDFGIMLNPEIKYYSYEQFQNIDWYPKTKEIDQVKLAVIELAKARITEAYTLHTQTELIRSFYKPSIDLKNSGGIRTKDWDELRVKAFVEANYAHARTGGYFIWGAKKDYCNYGVCSFETYIKSINPNLKFAGWIDTYKTGTLAGKPIISPDELSQASQEGDFIIVAADKAIEDALKKFEDMALNDHQYLICAPIRNAEERDLPAKSKI